MSPGQIKVGKFEHFKLPCVERSKDWSKNIFVKRKKINQAEVFKEINFPWKDNFYLVRNLISKQTFEPV